MASASQKQASNASSTSSSPRHLSQAHMSLARSVSFAQSRQFPQSHAWLSKARPGPGSTSHLLRLKSMSRSSSTESSDRSSSSPSVGGRACHYCGGAESVLKKCSNCRAVKYCSRQCQAEDWTCHKIFCRARNPVYFNKEIRECIAWFFQLTKADMELCIIDSFKQRCYDEIHITSMLLPRNEIPRKFVRYLEAARGLVLSRDTFSKPELVQLRNNALLNHSISEVARIKPGKGSSPPSSRPQPSNNGCLPEEGFTPHPCAPESKIATPEQLSLLHDVICGPIESDLAVPRYNLI